MKNIVIKRLAVLLGLLMLVSCATAYYKTMEKFGYHKRDILVARVEDARDSQEEAGEQFKTTLEKFKEVVNFEGGQLEDKYYQLNDEYERATDRADEVTSRIDSVEKVAEDLFAEWQSELSEYSNADLRRASERTLRQTRAKYNKVVNAMRQMPPVLNRLKDQVLFLKHNLNARAIGSLEGTAAQLEDDVEDLLRDLEQSIQEANAFIDDLMEEE